MSIFRVLRMKLCVLLLVILSTFQQGLMVESREGRGGGSSSSSKRDLLIERKLQLLNKPAIKSIQSEDGDIIDCVDIHKQPAFDHPLLKNHTIQMKPSHTHNLFHVEGEDDPPTSTSAKQEARQLLLSSQLWLKSGSCPEGTIPIRRVQKHHLLNAPSIENYGRKNISAMEKYEVSSPNGTLSYGFEAQHAAAVLVASGYNYIGALADINIWNPHVEADDEYSSSMISLRNGEYIIECGWTVNPAIYGDRRARLYAYWTNDSGKTSGCNDLLCAGFVQTNQGVALGAVLDPVSQDHGQQYIVNFFVSKDATDPGHWWLILKNGAGSTAVGYWPASIFSTVSTLVLFGGEVYSPRMRERPHTATAMGSGRYALDHFGSAAYIGQPRIRDSSTVLKYPDPYGISALRPDCYSGENYAQQLFTEPLFFFGGPGRGPHCL